MKARKKKQRNKEIKKKKRKGIKEKRKIK